MSDDDATKNQKNKVEKNDEKAVERKEKRLVKVAIDSLSLRIDFLFTLKSIKANTQETERKSKR